jgi:peptidoglycan/LPS O-acetylase OafA/YrhL
MSTRGHHPGLDLLRAVAALGVVYGHAGLLRDLGGGSPHGPERFVAENGWKGIFLFFALSGYLISLPFVRSLTFGSPPPSMRGYARRRFARILPAHWIALCVMAFVVVPPDFTWGRFVAHVFLVQNLAPGVAHTILPVTWTLGLEAIFYVVVPAVTWCLARTCGGGTLGSAVAMVGAVWLLGLGVLAAGGSVAELPVTWTSVLVANILVPVVGYLSFFAPGILIAVLECHRSRGATLRAYEALRSHPGLCAVTAMGAWLAAALPPPPTVAGAMLSSAVNGCVGLFALVAVLGMSRRAESVVRRLAPLGECSYGVYLWHWIVIFFIATAAARVGLSHAVFFDQTVDWVIAAALTLPLASLSWRYVERPAIAWARGRGRALTGGDRPVLPAPANRDGLAIASSQAPFHR